MNIRVCEDHPSDRILGQTRRASRSILFLRPPVRINQLGADRPNAEFRLKGLEQLLQPVRRHHRVVVEEEEIFAAGLFGAAITLRSESRAGHEYGAAPAVFWSREASSTITTS
jgi:hypothetical protein